MTCLTFYYKIASPSFSEHNIFQIEINKYVSFMLICSNTIFQHNTTLISQLYARYISILYMYKKETISTTMDALKCHKSLFLKGHNHCNTRCNLLQQQQQHCLSCEPCVQCSRNINWNYCNVPLVKLYSIFMFRCTNFLQ